MIKIWITELIKLSERTHKVLPNKWRKLSKIWEAMNEEEEISAFELEFCFSSVLFLKIRSLLLSPSLSIASFFPGDCNLFEFSLAFLREKKSK